MKTLKTLFGCDLRTLALFRVGLGLSLLVDLISRAREFRAHYTSFGVSPLASNPETFRQVWIDPWVGTSWFQGSVFVAAGLAALAVLVGYRTRLATALGWGLLLFIQAQNKMVLQGGDNLFILLFFWSIFLPLGARYSFDAAMDPSSEEEQPNQYFSMATVGILLQVAGLYFFSALLKDAPEWMPDGTAIYYALHLESFVQPFGEWMREFPSMMKGLTYYTWVLELVGPLLLFSPWLFLSLRLSMLILLVLLHVGIIVCMNVGLFPLFNFVSLVVFLPSWCWDRLASRFKNSLGTGVTIFYDEDCEFCRKICLVLKTFLVMPHTPILPAQTHPPILEIMERDNTWIVQDQQGAQYTEWQAILFLLRQSVIFWPVALVLRVPVLSRLGTKLYRVIARNRGALSRFTHLGLPYHRQTLTLPSYMEWGVGVVVLYMLFINISTLPQWPEPIPDPFKAVRGTFGLNQKWNMFAPSPRKWDGWYMVPGKLIDGTTVDVYNLRMQAPTEEGLGFKESPYAIYRWRKYLQRLVMEKHEYHRKYYGAYLCRRWNETKLPLQHLLSFQIFFFQVNTPPPNTPPTPPEKILIWNQSCLDS